jgi:hypothetical protein
MFRLSITAALILSLLACPLVCRTGLALPWLAKGKLAATHTCCPHCQAKPDHQLPHPSAPSPAPSDSKSKCDCICAGAVIGASGDALVVDLPLSLDSPQLAIDFDTEQNCLAAHGFLAPHDDAAPSGRMLRALISSLLC